MLQFETFAATHFSLSRIAHQWSIEVVALCKAFHFVFVVAAIIKFVFMYFCTLFTSDFFVPVLFHRICDFWPTASIFNFSD